MLLNMTEKQHRPMSRNKLDLNAKVTTDGHDWATGMPELRTMTHANTDH